MAIRLGQSVLEMARPSAVTSQFTKGQARVPASACPGSRPWGCYAPPPGDTQGSLAKSFYGSIPPLAREQDKCPLRRKRLSPECFCKKGLQVPRVQHTVNSAGFIPSLCTRDSTLPILESMCLWLQRELCVGGVFPEATPSGSWALGGHVSVTAIPAQWTEAKELLSPSLSHCGGGGARPGGACSKDPMPLQRQGGRR